MLYIVLEGRLGLSLIAQIVAVNLANGKKRRHAILASRIFTAQKHQLSDGIAVALLIVEKASLFVEQFGDGQDRNVGAYGIGSCVIDLAICLHRLFVVSTCAACFGFASQNASEFFSGVILGQRSLFFFFYGAARLCQRCQKADRGGADSNPLSEEGGPDFHLLPLYSTF